MKRDRSIEHRVGRVRIGVDLASLADVEESLERYGRRYVDRIFTSRELAADDSLRPEFLAGRFAAKEAVIKALEPGRAGVDFRSVEILRGPTGASRVRLAADAASLARDRGVRHISVSLTHEAGLALAVAAAYCGRRSAPRRASALWRQRTG